MRRRHRRTGGSGALHTVACGPRCNGRTNWNDNGKGNQMDQRKNGREEPTAEATESEYWVTMGVSNSANGRSVEVKLRGTLTPHHTAGRIGLESEDDHEIASAIYAAIGKVFGEQASVGIAVQFLAEFAELAPPTDTVRAFTADLLPLLKRHFGADITEG